MAKLKSTHSSDGSRLVYSTEDPDGSQRRSAGKSRPEKAHSGGPRRAKDPYDGIVRVSRQTKGRKGKGVTVVQGLQLEAAELSKLSAELKKMCGSGGTTKAGVIEIQGEHCDRLIEELRRRGWRVKRAGG